MRLDDETWQDFIAETMAVMVVSRSTCESCKTYLDEIDDSEVSIPIAHVLLDGPGIEGLRRENSWIETEVDILPHTIIWSSSQRIDSFPGARLERLHRAIELAAAGDAGRK